MKEHALFIQLGLPANRPDLRREAERFEEVFARLERVLNRVQRLRGRRLRQLKRALVAFIDYKERLLRLLVACRLPGNALFPLLIDHITREAKRFLHLLSRPEPESRLHALLQEHVFWLRVMKEHVEFVRHLLDPSERMLIRQAEEFIRTFSRLLETANELESMDSANPRSFNTVRRFTDEVIVHTRALRDFKAAAYELLLACQALSIIPSPLLADHIRREADKFLQELSLFVPTESGTK
ncbi:MAG: DUF2935 domain-containing protein [Firmicutes bacterium]|nr:DUF2935 domain-containing protein [Bacillota bacterium]